MSADADTDTEPAASGPDRGGVAIPSWLAGALVVVLDLLVAGAGFAIGRATAPDHDGFRPIVATEGGGPGPGRGGGPRDLPGFPGGPQGRGGGEGPGARPGFPGERDRTYDDSDSGSDSDSGPDSGDDSDSDSGDTPAPPQLPGT